MAKHIDFEHANFILDAPLVDEKRVTKDAKGNTCVDGIPVDPLRVFKDDASRQFVSCWQLSAAEMLEVIRTGRVYLFILGFAHPPVYVTGMNVWNDQVADFEDVPEIPVIEPPPAD